jgi:hypothetical protein
MTEAIVEEINRQVENETRSPTTRTRLIPERLAYQEALARQQEAGGKYAEARRQHRLLDKASARLLEQKRTLQMAHDQLYENVRREEANRGFFERLTFSPRRPSAAEIELSKAQAQLSHFPTRRHQVIQAARDAAKAASDVTRTAMDAARRNIDEREVLLNRASAAITSSRTAFLSSVTSAQIEGYLSGDSSRIWTDDDLSRLDTRVRTTAASSSVTSLKAEGLFNEWEYLYGDVFTATEAAYQELNRVAGRYVQSVEDRRKLYLSIATGLVKIVADRVGAGKIVDMIGAGVKYLYEEFERNAMQRAMDAAADVGGQIASAATDALKAKVEEKVSALVEEGNARVDELKDTIAKGIADKVEANHTLTEFRDRIRQGQTAVDVSVQLANLRQEIVNALRAVRGEFIKALGNENIVKIARPEAGALLRVMAQREGFDTVLQAATPEMNLIAAKKADVMEKAELYCDARAALFLNELFERYDCPSKTQGSADRQRRLMRVMERWVFAKFIADTKDEALLDMANAFGMIEESALLEKLIALQVVTRRTSYGAMDEAGNAANLAAAAAGRAFSVGRRTLGEHSARAMKAWAKAILQKNPLELAAA